MSRHVDTFIKKYSLNRECQICHNTEWNGKPIPLEWHHIDGNPNNNEFNNIQILCPNCHAQTDNYKGKNRKSKLKTIHYCDNCGKELSGRTKTGLCQKCYAELEQKNSKCPEKEILEQDLKELKYLTTIAKKYEVSDRAVRKWLDKYSISRK